MHDRANGILLPVEFSLGSGGGYRTNQEAPEACSDAPGLRLFWEFTRLPIRAHNVLRAGAACLSADVLTPVERFVEREQRRTLPRPAPVNARPVERRAGLLWADVPEIRSVLAMVIR